MDAIPNEFVCPISHEIMEHPVTLVETASVFDKQSIEEWLSRGNMSCPLTGLPISSTSLIENRPLRQAIERWCLENPGCRSSLGSAAVVGVSQERPSEERAHWRDWMFGCFGVRRKRKRKDEEIAVGEGSTGQARNMMSIRAATRLSHAVRKGDINTVKDMMRGDRDVNVLDEAGRAPLHWAAIYGDVGIVRVLVHYNAQIDLPARDSGTALHFAAQFNQLEVVRFMIAQGAHVNVVSVNGYTPLHKAAYWGRAEMVEVLLKSGANRYLRNGENRLPVDVARESPNPGAQAVLDMFRMHETR